MNEFLRKLLFLPPEGDSVARSVDHLHFLVIGTTMVGAFGVTLLALAFVIRYRRRGEDLSAAQPNPSSRSVRRFDMVMIGGLFSLFIAFWLIGVMQYDRIRHAPADAMVVYVEAKQWMWKFDYPDGRRTTDTLYVPAGRAVKAILSSRDVIHSFFLPEFRVKMDAVPGRTTTIWFKPDKPGTYPILCAEFCGAGHSVMRGQVVALSDDDYQKWLQDHPQDLARRGEIVAAEKGCLKCHSVDGTAHIGPTWAGLYGSRVPLEGGGTVVVDEAYITESMMDPVAKVHRGFRPVMPTFQGLVDPGDTAAIIEFIRSLADHEPTQPIQQVQP